MVHGYCRRAHVRDDHLSTLGTTAILYKFDPTKLGF